MGNTKQKPELKPVLQTEERLSSSTGSKINDRTSGGAYTEIPKFDESNDNLEYKKYFKNFLLALVVAGSTYGAYKYFSGPSQRMPSSVAAAEERRPVLTVTEADLDLKATDEVRSALLSGKKVDLIQTQSATSYALDLGNASQQPNNINSLPQDSEKTQPSQQLQQNKVEDAAKPAQQDIKAADPSQPDQSVVQQLPAIPAPEAIVEKIKSGEMKYYSFQIFDSADEDGDIVEILVDGQSIGYIDMSNSGLTVSLPLEEGKSHTLTVRGIRDGYGGITFGAQLMTSKAVFDWFNPGDIRIIDLRFGDK